ncbi:vacuolar protein sorting-associated protein 45 [Phaffia rhodozyma]|uniref:Vacuolar protein sorting-associated protein 45 n=1 Tax=Phaffia rhodozyma TaxID=264483 RepID=A0A0F7SMW3_PHARH|nr:vacuolar protein sorting-associated protein 45 [Phaffia rhodozyma]
MDTLKAIQTYLDRMLTEVSGMKVLLLDAHTTPILSLVATQSSLLSHEVYLTDRIDNPKRDRMPHLKCIMFISPDPETLEWAKEELAQPRYGNYWLYFSNVLTKSSIELLAQADEFEVVKEVQEYFADYLSILPNLFTLSAPPLSSSPHSSLPPVPLYSSTPHIFNPPMLDIHLQGLLSLLLSLKKKPVIRWERMSGVAKKLAEEVGSAITDQSGGVYGDLFGFKGTSGPAPVLIMLDRRNDPVTPLLSQWTYQAMVHELVGIVNGRVRLEDETRPELKEVILSPSQDPFFSTHLFSNFGDLGASLATYVSEFQKRSTVASNPGSIETVADMKRFVEEYPEFRKLGGNVSKHVALVGELSRIVERDGLLGISELEQSLASNESHTADLKNVLNLLSTPSIPSGNKLRLAILYALRYQRFSANAIPHVVDTLINNGLNPDRARLVYAMLNFAGADQRQDDLFMNENLFSRGKSLVKGLQGVENVYTQHKPHLLQTVDLLLKGRLKETSYPYLEVEESGISASVARTQRPQDIILFMVGGTTYEEARAVALLNQQLQASANATSGNPSSAPRILLGGTCVHNSKSFLDMVEESATRFPPSFYSPPSTMTSVPTPLGLGLPQLSHLLPSSSNGSSPSLPQNSTGNNLNTSSLNPTLPTTTTTTNASTPTVTSSAPSTNTSSTFLAGAPAINLRLGKYEVGTAGVYRTSGGSSSSSGGLQIDGNRVKEGLTNGLAGARDLGGSILGRVRQEVEARRGGAT